MIKFCYRLPVVILFFVFIQESCMAVSSMKIVSLAQSLTNNLVTMGAESEIVGCTDYCRTKTKKQIVATSINVNVEKVLTLKPNLVIATDLTNKNAIKSLRNLGLNVVVYQTPKSFEEICEQYSDLGRRAGKAKEASAIIAQTKKTVNAIRAVKRNPYKMFIQIGSNPLFSVIPGTYMDELITFTGSRNIAFDMKSGSINRESVVNRNPDVIFIASMGGIGATEKKQWETFKTINAVKNRKIFIIDSDKACNPSPVSFAETLEMIVKSAYGK